MLNDAVEGNQTLDQIGGRLLACLRAFLHTFMLCLLLRLFMMVPTLPCHQTRRKLLPLYSASKKAISDCTEERFVLASAGASARP